MINTHEWWESPLAKLDLTAIEAAKIHQSKLTKPPGALGELETIAIKFAGWLRDPLPVVSDIQITIFAADHGVCAQGVSAFPQIVTTQMIANFASGGAAISVLARENNAQLSIVNLGTAHPVGDFPNVKHNIVANGTQDFTKAPAMSEAQCKQALEIGAESVVNTDVFIGGEMGIGNTTSAAALYAKFLEVEAQDVVGPGTGINKETMEKKIQVVQKGFHIHRSDQPLEILANLGGFEIVALVGAYIRCAQKGIPIIVDGYICTVAAIAAERIAPGAANWMLFAHQSAEPAHTLALKHLKATPIVNLGLRLGEGSGAALVIPIIKQALALHSTMATFEQANVNDGIKH